MEAATVLPATDAATADALEAQASALTNRARMLREQADELSRESARMKGEAERIRKPHIWGPVSVAPRHVRRFGRHASGTDDAQLLGSIVDRLARREAPASSADLAHDLGTSQERVRDALLRLEQLGEVKRRGLSRGTRWMLPAEDDDATPAPPAHRQRSLETTIRDACRDLDVFTFDELRAKLPDVSEQSLRRWLPQFEARGWLYGEAVGSGKASRTKLYEWLKPKATSTPRPKQAPPEVEVARKWKDRPESRRQRRGGPVAGTGKARTITDADVRGLVEQITAQGAVIEGAGSGHLRVLKDGNLVATIASTPSDFRARLNDRAQLRRAGFEVD